MAAIKLTVAVLCALSVVAGLAAGSASAEWFTGNTKLATGSKVALNPVGVVEKPEVFAAPSLGLKITCGAEVLTSEAPEIIGPNAFRAKRLSFEDCETTNPAKGCELESQPTTIASLPVKGTETKGAKEPEATLAVEPQSKKTFFEISFKEEDTCALAGAQPVMGKVTLAAPTGGEQLVEQYVEGMGTKSSGLTIGSTPVYLESGGIGFAVNGLEPFPIGNIAEPTFPGVTSFPTSLVFEKENQIKSITFLDANPGSSTHVLAAATIPDLMASYSAFSIYKDGCKGVVLKGRDENTCTIQVEYKNYLLLPRPPGTAAQQELVIPNYIRVPLEGP
jgi:hypothetical protein